MTSNYPANNNSTTQTLPATSMPLSFEPFNDMENTEHLHQHCSDLSFESAHVHSDYNIPEWPMNPSQDSNLFRYMYSAYNSTFSTEIRPGFILQL
jgi:hypothetical protein